MCDSHYYVLGKEGEMFEDREIIPKCFNGLDSKTIHLYNVSKKKLIKGIIVLIITKFSRRCLSFVKINLNALLLYKNAYHMVHNSNMKTQFLLLEKSKSSCLTFKIQLSRICPLSSG